MALQTPEPLRTEHEEIHAEMVEIRKLGGKIAETLEELIKVMHPHFVREEEIAMPPLSLLASSVKTAKLEDAEEAIEMAKMLEEELPKMLKEHEEIKAKAEKLKEVGIETGNAHVSTFGEKIVLHAQTEEEIYYPATILLGKYLLLKK